ncbi:MAG: O-antigen ligase family protein [Sphingobacteriales bacterium]|nr:MAG: O-antigen ligase family protein [Sphingobacteriales bacterium]
MNNQIFNILSQTGQPHSLPLFSKVLSNTTKWLLAVVLLVFSFGVAYLTATSEITYGAVLLALIVGIPALLICLFSPLFGINVLLVVSFCVMGVKKYLPGEPPLGILLDVFTFFLFFGIFIRQSFERNISVLKHPVTVLILIWIAYNLLEVLNPNSQSQMAWFYTVRGMAGLTLLYFVVLYAFNNLKSIGVFVHLLIFLTLLAAIYGIYQEFNGFNSIEWAWINADETRYELIYQWGRFRKFSFLSDPTTFGILTAYIGVFCFCLSTSSQIGLLKRIYLLLSFSIMVLAMVYSGTRAAFVLIPIGLALFAFITFKPRIIIISTVLFFAGAIVVVKSPGNATLYRVRSAFTPAKDESMQLRLQNQKNVQPFIRSNPMGGGLGSTGEWGKRFSPNSELSKFPPDSGLIRIAVEQGWIGLLLFTIFTFSVLVLGIRTYIRSRDPAVKSYSLAFLMIVALLTVANYPQEAIVLLPNSIIYYISVAALVRLRQIDLELVGNTELQTKSF